VKQSPAIRARQANTGHEKRPTLAASTAQQIRSVVTAADVVALSGGNPFHLLAVGRRVAFGDAVRSATTALWTFAGHGELGYLSPLDTPGLPQSKSSSARNITRAR
jgi:hypothetical protein